MRINKPVRRSLVRPAAAFQAPLYNRPRTHEGAPAAPDLTIEQQLRRSVMSCLLFEDEFYESGQAIADRIMHLALAAPPPMVAEIARQARHDYKLRHVPLWLLVALCETGRGDSTGLVSDAIAETIGRADELAELLALYNKRNQASAKRLKGGLVAPKLSKQLRKGLARALAKFDEYQLRKWDNGAIGLKTVMRLSHPKPRSQEQAELWARLKTGNLAVANTWEVQLSAGREQKSEADKHARWTQLLESGKLGYMALLRNLRNMQEAAVDRKLIEDAIRARRGGAQKVLPFRFLAAARAAPSFAAALDYALIKAVEDLPVFEGETLVLVDTSGSMQNPLAAKRKNGRPGSAAPAPMRRVDAAASLACLVRGNVRCFSFATDVKEVPHRIGLAGIDAFELGAVGHGTNAGKAVLYAAAKYPRADRMIVVSDEQSADEVPEPVDGFKGYMINVGSNQNGVGYGTWTHIDGFSEAALRFIAAVEGRRDQAVAEPDDPDVGEED